MFRASWIHRRKGGFKVTVVAGSRPGNSVTTASCNGGKGEQNERERLYIMPLMAYGPALWPLRSFPVLYVHTYRCTYTPTILQYRYNTDSAPRTVPN